MSSVVTIAICYILEYTLDIPQRSALIRPHSGIEMTVMYSYRIITTTYYDNNDAVRTGQLSDNIDLILRMYILLVLR